MWMEKTEHPSGGESSESLETNGGRVSGVHFPQERDPPVIQQRGRGGRGYQRERGSVAQSQRGHRRYGGRGYPQGHGRSQSQGIAYSCSPSDYHGSEAQLQGTIPPHYGSPMLESGRRGRGGDREAGGLSHGASRPSTPELYQATQAQDQANETPAESSLHLRSLPEPLELSLLAARQQFEQLSVGASSNTTQPVGSSRDSTRSPLHAGKGNNGVKCLVKANYFYTELQEKDLHHYDVSFTPEVTSRRVNRLVMKQLVELYRDSQLGSRLPAYDGVKNLYAAGPLPFTSHEFSITLVDEYDDTGSPRRECRFRVVIKLVARIGLISSGLFSHNKQANTPQAIHFLNTVLRQYPTSRSTLFPVGQSFYSPDFGRQTVGEGVEIWHGFYQSIRPTKMGLSLNVDMSSSAFIEPLPVIDFVTCLLKGNVLGRPLSDADHFKIKKALKGVQVEVTHRGNMRKKYRISGLTSNQTSDLTFSVAGGVMKSLVQYFRETYGVVIQHTLWPCLLMGNQQKPQYLPMEVCKIVKGQRYTKKLNERQMQTVLKATCHRPHDLESNISEMVCDVRHNADHRDIYAEEFGIKISEQLASVEARILPAPWLKYHDKGKDKQCLPEFGQWNMKNKKLVNGGTVNNWACINFSQNVQDSVARRFCYELAQTCCFFGMVFNLKPILPTYHARPDELEIALMTVHKDAMIKLQPQHKELDLVIVILPDHNGFLYGDLKRICETDLGLVSQCCLAKNVFKMNRQYLSNIVLKINVKVGGRNTVLVDALSRSIPRVTDRPTIIFGADVTHPHAGDDSSPSIAAVVASQDWPEVSKYAGLVCAQAHRQEIIADLYKEWKDPVGGTVTGGMVKEHLMSFSKETGRIPERIIFYRDGIGEDQFGQVLYHELQSIRKACASLQQDYQPRVTFVVIQKHHHTRLFVNDHLNRRAGNESGNVLPGTVVDSKICHPIEFDFYLCSHVAIRGTSRPAHYHVLWDENEFTADELQSFTNNLCYTYARCTHSVSIVPPAYYAHLAAYRARCYMEPETFEVVSLASGAARSGSGPGSSGAHSSTLNPGANSTVTRLPGEGVAVKRLPDIKENVKKMIRGQTVFTAEHEQLMRYGKRRKQNFWNKMNYF